MTEKLGPKPRGTGVSSSFIAGKVRLTEFELARPYCSYISDACGTHIDLIANQDRGKSIVHSTLFFCQHCYNLFCYSGQLASTSNPTSFGDFLYVRLPSNLTQLHLESLL